jgi:NitT/TauT family transport system permease protein
MRWTYRAPPAALRGAPAGEARRASRWLWYRAAAGGAGAAHHLARDLVAARPAWPNCGQVPAAGLHHDAAGARADRAGQPDLGADRRLCRLRPRAGAIVQPVAQFLAAFPANLLFPVAVSLIVAWKLNPDIWLSPLMVLGTQWYILFNVIAGASAMPPSCATRGAQSSASSGWLWWRKVALPACFPTTSPARSPPRADRGTQHRRRVASWGDTTLQAHGLGAYIADATAAGDFTASCSASP